MLIDGLTNEIQIVLLLEISIPRVLRFLPSQLSDWLRDEVIWLATLDPLSGAKVFCVSIIDGSAFLYLIQQQDVFQRKIRTFCQ